MHTCQVIRIFRNLYEFEGQLRGLRTRGHNYEFWGFTGNIYIFNYSATSTFNNGLDVAQKLIWYSNCVTHYFIRVTLGHRCWFICVQYIDKNGQYSKIIIRSLASLETNYHKVPRFAHNNLNSTRKTQDRNSVINRYTIEIQTFP